MSIEARGGGDPGEIKKASDSALDESGREREADTDGIERMNKLLAIHEDIQTLYEVEFPDVESEYRERMDAMVKRIKERGMASEEDKKAFEIEVNAWWQAVAEMREKGGGSGKGDLEPKGEGGELEGIESEKEDSEDGEGKDEPVTDGEGAGEEDEDEPVTDGEEAGEDGEDDKVDGETERTGGIPDILAGVAGLGAVAVGAEAIRRGLGAEGDVSKGEGESEPKGDESAEGDRSAKGEDVIEPEGTGGGVGEGEDEPKGDMLEGVDGEGESESMGGEEEAGGADDKEGGDKKGEGEDVVVVPTVAEQAKAPRKTLGKRIGKFIMSSLPVGGFLYEAMMRGWDWLARKPFMKGVLEFFDYEPPAEKKK